MLGQRETFYVRDEVRAQNFTVPSTLIAIGKHSLWFRADVEPKMPASTIHHLVDFFDEMAYPKITETFGEFRGPNPEGDARISFLFFDFRLTNHDHAVAYVHPLDLIPPDCLRPDQRSNQRKLVYLNSSFMRRDLAYVRSTLGHEFVHLVLHSYDFLEESWVSEGLAELGTALCGGGDYLKQKLADLKDVPDQPLVWSRSLRDTNRDYAIAYLWNHYLYCWTGGGKRNFFRQVVADRQTGLGTYLGPLQALGLKLSDMYASFWVANFFNNRDLGRGCYYDDFLAQFRLSRRDTSADSLPVTVLEQLSMGGGKGLVVRLPSDAPSDLVCSVVHPFNILQTPDPATLGSQDVTAAFILQSKTSAPRVIFQQLAYDKAQDVYRADLAIPSGGARSIGVVLASRKSLGIPADSYEYTQEPFGICIGSNDQALAKARSRMTIAVLFEEKLQWYISYSEGLTGGSAAQKDSSLRALEGLTQEVVQMISSPTTCQMTLECFLERVRQQPPARRKVLRPMIKKVRDFVAAGVAQGNESLRPVLTAFDQVLPGS
ncbi:MAG: hypothetical protein GX442_23885 [Candidatus Riflebacteria bacterium]|nr:hypothetical protein [Candidatus Riflebacteria bacterium]